MSTQRSVQLQMRQDVARPMIRVFGVVCLLALGSPGQAAQLPTWSLAEPPLAEIGTSDGVLLGNVVDAAVMADGSVLLLDWQSREILRLSPDGEVTAVLGGLGEGPGEFVNPSSVFAFGDTMDGATLEVWSPSGDTPERRVALPILPSPYSRDAIRSAKAETVERYSGEMAKLTEDRFDGVLASLPPLAPSAQRIVAMGEDAWIQPFSGDSVPTEWIVAHPASGTVRATAVVDPKMRLLAGSQDVAVLRGRTEALEEQFVQLRRIVRGGVR